MPKLGSSLNIAAQQVSKSIMGSCIDRTNRGAFSHCSGLWRNSLPTYFFKVQSHIVSYPKFQRVQRFLYRIKNGKTKKRTTLCETWVIFAEVIR